MSGPLTDAELRASAVAVSAAALPLPTDAATEATLLNVDANLTDIQTQQIDGTQRSRITNGTNDAAVSNAAPTGTEYGLAVRPVFACRNRSQGYSQVSGVRTAASTSSSRRIVAARSLRRLVADTSSNHPRR